MSKQSLHTFLTKLDKELSKKDGSKDFRAKKANKRLHTFTYRKSKLEKTLALLLQSSNNLKEEVKGTTLQELLTSLHSEELAKSVNKRLLKLGKDLHAKFKRIADKQDSLVTLSTAKNQSAQNFTLTVIVSASGKKDNFNYIRRTYKNLLDTFYKDFLKELQMDSLDRETKVTDKNPDGIYRAKDSGGVFHLEHSKASSNIKHFINDAIHEGIISFLNEEGSTLDSLVDEVKEYGLFNTLNIEKNTKTGDIDIFLGSQIVNSKQAAKESKIRGRVQKSLKRAIKQLDAIEDLKGSDSLKESTRKKVIKSATDPFKKLKNVTVTTEDTKIDGLISSATLKVKNGKVTRGKNNPITIRKRRVKNSSGNARSVGSSPLAYIQLLNAKLPAQIAKNMRSPRLNYRTGRFASSVRIVNAATTAQGFLSFGYTYMKGPYQTFEPGYAQGSVDRDPRKLIDKSMREIAVEFAIGRFYTRRE